MLDKTIIKNISSLFSIRMAGYIIPLFTLPYLVRVLEPIGYRTLAFSLAIVQYFIIAVNYGFDLSATQKIAQSGGDKLTVSIIYWNVLAVRILIAFFGFIFLLFLSTVIDEIDLIFPILLCTYIAVFGAALFPQWLFQGKEQLGVISLIHIVLQLILIPFIFIFVNNSNDIWIATLLSSMPSIMIVIFSTYLMIKRNWITLCLPSFNGIKNELKDGWQLFLASAAISLYTTSTIVILGSIAGPISVAVYVSANKLLKAAQGIYAPISASFYPNK
jgi:PST family polysaccharide transporter